MKEIEEIIERAMKQDPVEPRGEIDFCWLFEEFGNYFFHHIVSIEEDGTWLCECVDLDSPEIIVSHHCGVDPSTEDDKNNCYQITLEEFKKIESLAEPAFDEDEDY